MSHRVMPVAGKTAQEKHFGRSLFRGCGTRWRAPPEMEEISPVDRNRLLSDLKFMLANWPIRRTMGGMIP